MSRKKHSTNSLWHQADSSIRACFSENLDKHSLKSSSGYLADTYHVFSYAQRRDLLDLSSQALRYIKTHYPEIRFVKDVKVIHLNEFLKSKASTCSTETLKQYGTRLRKISRCVNHFYRVDTDWSNSLKIPESLITTEGERQRKQQLTREDFDLIIKRSASSDSKATIAFELSARFGLRVEGAAIIKAGNVHLDREGQWGFGQVFIREKGARPRDIDIMSAGDRDFIKNLATDKKANELLVGIKKNSINKQLTRIMTELGIKGKYPKTATHSIRKLYAQTCWDKCRTEGFSVREAIRYVNTQLGHNETRDRQLLSIYVANMW